MIVFADVDDRALTTVLTDCAEYYGGCAVLDTAEAAFEVSHQVDDRDQGLFLVKKEFCRGFNLQLTVDATVVVLDTEGSLTYSEVKQMAGRSSRA